MNHRYGEYGDGGESRRSAQEERYGQADRERDRYGSDEYRRWGDSDNAERDDMRYRGGDDERSRSFARRGPREGQRGYSGRDFGEGGSRNYGQPGEFDRDRASGGEQWGR